MIDIVQKWWAIYRPNEDLISFKRLNGGQLNDVYLINNKYVLKIFLKEFVRFDSEKNALIELQKSKFSPQLFECSENGQDFGKPYILMEYLDGLNLSEEFYNLDQNTKKSKILQVAGLIKEMNYTVQKIIPISQSSKIKTKVEIMYKDFMDFIPLEIRSYTENILKEESEIHTEFENNIFTHGDLHLGNFIGAGEKLKLIDYEFAKVSSSWRELGTLITSFTIPADFTPEEIEQFYPNGFLIDYLFVIKKEYPELFRNVFKSCLQLAILKRILEKYNPQVEQNDIPHSRAIFLFDQVFKQELLDELIS